MSGASDWNDCAQALSTIWKNATDAASEATPEVAKEAAKKVADEQAVALIAKYAKYIQIFKKYLPAISVGLTALHELKSFHQWYYYDREDNKNRQKNSRNDILWTKKRFEKCQNDRQRLRILKQMEKLVDAQMKTAIDDSSIIGLTAEFLMRTVSPMSLGLNVTSLPSFLLTSGLGIVILSVPRKRA